MNPLHYREVILIALISLCTLVFCAASGFLAGRIATEAKVIDYCNKGGTYQFNAESRIVCQFQTVQEKGLRL